MSKPRGVEKWGSSLFYLKNFTCYFRSNVRVSQQNNNNTCYKQTHDDVIKWKHFSRYWPFVRGISPLSKHTLATKYHVYIWQLCCGNTCQHKCESRNLMGTFARSKILLTEKLTNVSNSHPGYGATSSAFHFFGTNLPHVATSFRRNNDAIIASCARWTLTALGAWYRQRPPECETRRRRRASGQQ